MEQAIALDLKNLLTVSEAITRASGAVGNDCAQSLQRCEAAKAGS